MRSLPVGSVSVLGWVTLLAACGSLAACRADQTDRSTGARGRKAVIQMRGSDSLVNVALGWAEEYEKVAPDVEVEVSGGGSAAGIAALIQGAVDIANASGPMRPSETEAAIAHNPGRAPRATVVGVDALAIYVHKENPLEEITLDQLRRIYAEDGDVTRWSQLGVSLAGVRKDSIVLVSRQSNSGTYEFFREHVLANKDFRLGSRELNGSKDIVALVGVTRAAIGFGGMGYATPEVKTLKVSPWSGAPAIAPTVESASSHSYPLARPLLLYTLGEPQGAVRDYIDWILSDAGQRVVEASGYAPAPRQPLAAPHP
jgi:phosphate transport system substrate-binding protein